ncbi:MAG TPA: FtsX-like permease family protein [Ktedonobacteraceae bacterium]|nr:FtsX-like permease family protein [Ktedonobacteraceae bacterium]
MKFLSVLNRKAIADVTKRKGRTILIILGIFIGVLGLTAVNGSNDLFGKDLNSAISSSFDIFFAVDNAPPALITQLEQTNNVAALQQRTTYATTWHLPGNAGTTPFHLYGYPDLQHVQVGTLQLVSGRLPGAGEIAMDTNDQSYAPVALGDMVKVNIPGGQQSTLRVVGLIRSVGMAALSTTAQGYMSIDGLQQIAPASLANSLAQGSPALTQQILVKTRNAADNEQTFYALSSVLNSAHAKLLNPTGYISPQATASSNFILQGLFIVFLVLAVVALLLTCLMILSTMNNMLGEQFKIIGTMKAIGGTRGKIMRSYLLSVSIYALIGTALGLGLGLLLTAQVSSLVTQQTKVDLGPYQIAPWVVLISLAAGLLAPILAALLPLWIGTRITVHQAMASYGITTNNTRDTQVWGQRLPHVPQTVWLGLRSVFRKPGRALLTLLALMLAVTVFMAAQITNTSIGVTNSATNFVSSDFQISLGSLPVPYQQISSALLNLPNVALVEPLDQEDVQISGHGTRVFGVPDMTHLYRPKLVAGRWLQDHELNTLVISDIAAQRLNTKVGQTLTLSQGTHTVSWEVVGIVHELAYASGSADPHGRYGAMFTTLDNLDTTLRTLPVGTADILYLNAHDHSQATLQRLRGEIQNVLQQAGLLQGQVAYATSGLNLTVAIYALIDTLAIVVALVGLLGLSNTLAAEVLERRKEIGILRSLGATGWRVGLVFWIQGGTLAFLSWIPGILLALPAGYALVNILSAYVSPIEFSIDPIAIILTLAFILAVSLVASFAPALSASHTRIREILRYE